MQGTILTIPCGGARIITTPINGPLTLEGLKAAIGSGGFELVPGFDTIDYAGKVVPCKGLWDKKSKLNDQPINVRRQSFGMLPCCGPATRAC